MYDIIERYEGLCNFFVKFAKHEKQSLNFLTNTHTCFSSHNGDSVSGDTEYINDVLLVDVPGAKDVRDVDVVGVINV